MHKSGQLQHFVASPSRPSARSAQRLGLGPALGADRWTYGPHPWLHSSQKHGAPILIQSLCILILSHVFAGLSTHPAVCSCPFKSSARRSLPSVAPLHFLAVHRCCARRTWSRLTTRTTRLPLTLSMMLMNVSSREVEKGPDSEVSMSPRAPRSPII